MNLESLKSKPLYLSPKNDITESLLSELNLQNISIKGFIDSFKEGNDIFKKDIICNDDYLVVYSPNYWQEIIEDINSKNIYILSIVNSEYIFTKLDEFNGYKKEKVIDFNTLEAQKKFWANQLKSYIEQNQDLDKEEYGYSWGDPENQNDTLGNYLSINNKLQSKINSQTTILELGTLGGKWTKYMLNAKKIICVDINDVFIKAINHRYSTHLDKFEFYISDGDELSGIKSNSVDLVFCIDTLVRVEKNAIFNYLKEISRVLSEKGEAIIHLPNSDIEDCRNRDFIDLNTREINEQAAKYFSSFEINFTTIVHGILLYVKR
ncbi:MAG: class I SAM-dependent methyltransferase [Sulfurimonas sp.]|nr:class I SAM-dependent methyltransferase [Sulfurimonas sp.]